MSGFKSNSLRTPNTLVPPTLSTTPPATNTLAINEAAAREAKLLNKNRKGTILTPPQPTGF